MTKQASPGSSIARFDGPTGSGAWLERRVAESLIESAVKAFIERCRADYRAWLSEADLASLLFAELSRGVEARGLAQCAVHAEYPFRLPTVMAEDMGRRDTTLPVNLVLVVPDTILRVRGRHWSAQVVAALEVKRGFEREREIKNDIAKLAAIHEAWPEVMPYLVIVGYHNQQEDVAAIRRLSQEAGITLYAENYWGPGTGADQLELEPDGSTG